MVEAKSRGSVISASKTMITKKELSEHLSVSSRLITRLMADDKIPYVKVGATAVRFDLQKVLAALEGGQR